MKSNNKEKDRIVAYIDLLAFSNHVRKNTGDAMMVFSNYNTILHSKIRDGIAHPVDSYSSELQELARNTSIDSFEYFIPFSDSIFIVSDDVNSFIPQLSSFVYGCFHITSHFYIQSTKIAVILQKGNGLVFHLMTIITYRQSILILTIIQQFLEVEAYGEVFPIELWNIVDKGPEKRKSSCR